MSGRLQIAEDLLAATWFYPNSNEMSCQQPVKSALFHAAALRELSGREVFET
jgi:hypothetical protein